MVHPQTKLLKIIQCLLMYVISGAFSASFLRVPRSVTPVGSTTTPTTKFAFRLSIEITNRVFNDSLLNPNSQNYKKMYNEVNQLLADTFGCPSCATVGFYGGVATMDFRSESGSVIANTVIVFYTAAINKDVVKFEFLDNLRKHPDSVLQINRNYTDYIATPVPVTVPKIIIPTLAATITTTALPLTPPITITTTTLPLTPPTTITTTTLPLTLPTTITTTTLPLTPPTTITTTTLLLTPPTTITTTTLPLTLPTTITTTTLPLTPPTTITTTTLPLTPPTTITTTTLPLTPPTTTKGPAKTTPLEEITSTKDIFLNETSQHPNGSLTTTLRSGKRDNSAKGTRSTLSPSPKITNSSGESHRTETPPPTSSHSTDTTRMFTSTETTKSTRFPSSYAAKPSTSTKTKSSTTAQSAAGSKGSGLVGWLPVWAIALLVLASVILLLLIIYFIMLMVRWCCKKSKKVSEHPYVPENNSTLSMDSPINEPPYVHTLQPIDDPPKNKTGIYVVNA